ncbi:hypothetical protein, partial [Streptomyces sp. RPT161]|uniref:hypothetical protein n=1 Tax=Streptomyces sp. RPT161 TaxID=3015993 RepID=UPI0022B91C39
ARAVVRVEIALSRDELLCALANRYCSADQTVSPDEMPVEEIRLYVESWVSAINDIELNREAETLWFGFEDWPTEDQQRMRALARAIDRAYPPEQYTTVVLDGTPLHPRVRCVASGCGWSLASGEVEPMMRA